jgi:benzoyl-CoA reductase/2-hydroxyglutaryl-CoA dehydratase subunit BcrC/BadD/HgdB
MSPFAIEPFIENLRSRCSKLRTLRQNGTKILGYFCTYTPVELVHAVGFLPVRIMGGTGTVSAADLASPAFVCPYIRRALEEGLRHEYDFLSGIVQGYTCDVSCGVTKIWEQRMSGELFHTIPLPYNDNPEARLFFRAALVELIDKMQAIGGRYSEESLEKSLELYREIREISLELYNLRYDRRTPLTASEFHSVVLTGFSVPPEEYRRMLSELLGEIRNAADVIARPSGRGNSRSGDSVSVLVSGSLIEEPAVLDLLEISGGKVVADDLCTGLRSLEPPSGQGSDPIVRLIDRYMNRVPCPARSRAKDRATLLVRLIERSGARGVVFLFQKFCTPHLADHPILLAELKKKHIPSTTIEMDEAGINEGQMRTRFEAFFEMLRA